MRDIECFTERLAGVASVSGAAQGAAVVNQRPGVFQTRRRAFELTDARLEQVDAIACRLDMGERA